MLLNDDGMIHSQQTEKHELQGFNLDVELQLKMLNGFMKLDEIV